MKAIDRISDQHILTLGKFIVGCARLKCSSRWRSQLADCVRHKNFLPYVTATEQQHMRAMLERRGQGLIVGFNTAQILLAANKVAKEWGESPLVLEVAEPPASGSEQAASA